MLKLANVDLTFLRATANIPSRLANQQLLEKPDINRVAITSDLHSSLNSVSLDKSRQMYAPKGKDYIKHKIYAMLRNQAGK